MNQNLIFIPMLMHMLLVFFLFIKLGRVKANAVKSGTVDRSKTALDPKAWPEDVVKISNNIANQFETPMLFYGLSIIYFLTTSVNTIVVGLMSFYVISRYVHSYFHITKNYVPYRFRSFLIGVCTLLGLTVWQLVLLITAS